MAHKKIGKQFISIKKQTETETKDSKNYQQESGSLYLRNESNVTMSSSDSFQIQM